MGAPCQAIGLGISWDTVSRQAGWNLLCTVRGDGSLSQPNRAKLFVSLQLQFVHLNTSWRCCMPRRHIVLFGRHLVTRLKYRIQLVDVIIPLSIRGSMPSMPIPPLVPIGWLIPSWWFLARLEFWNACNCTMREEEASRPGVGRESVEKGALRHFAFSLRGIQILQDILTNILF